MHLLKTLANQRSTWRTTKSMYLRSCMPLLCFLSVIYLILYCWGVCSCSFKQRDRNDVKCCHSALFLSSSLNPGLYFWRMNDVRNGVRQLFYTNCSQTFKVPCSEKAVWLVLRFVKLNRLIFCLQKAALHAKVSKPQLGCL